jgi:hypothetical protein
MEGEMKRRVAAVVLFLLVGGCAAGPTSEPAAAVTQKTSALSGASAGPLVLGLALNGIFLQTTQASNPFSASSIGQFAQGDAIAATATAADGSVVIAHGSAAGGEVLLEDQTGALVSGGMQSVAPYGENGFVALGDLNGDGVADLVSTTVENFPSTGASSFLVNVTMADGAQPPPVSAIDQLTFPSGGALVVCDFDGDGVDDIIVAPLFTMYSGKTGTISSVPGAPAFFQTGDKLACGDLNGDGFEDLIIGIPGASPQVTDGDFEVISAPGAPGGTPSNFFTGVNSGIALSTGDDMSAGDLDGDGLAELVIAHQPESLSNVVNVFSAPGKTPPSIPPIVGFEPQSKVAVPKHTNPVPQPTTSDITVPYVVAYILYVPPGDKSVTDYISGTTLGSSETITIKTSTGGSADIKVPVAKAVSLDAKESITYTDITTMTNGVSTTETTEVLYSPPSGQDEPDHRFDQYVINFNVKGTVTDKHDGQPPTVTLDMSSGKLIGGVLAAFLQEIANSQPVTIDDPTVKGIITGAIDTPDKANGLLALDPFFAGPDINDIIAQNPKRFVPFIPDGHTDNVVGLPHPIGVVPDAGPPGPTTFKFTGSRGTTTGTGTGNETSISVSGTLTLFSALTLGGSYTTSYSIVDSTTKTTTTGDAITLGTDHLCEQGDVSLYQDLMFGGSFLTVQSLSNPCKATTQALSFEALADWQVQDGGSGTLSSTSVSGAASLSVTAAPGGWTPIVSIPLSSSILRQVATGSDLSKVSFALNIPTTQPNPYWVGDAQMFISSPNANVFNQPLGEVNLTGLPEGQFNRIGFTIPSYALPAITGDNPDVTFTIVLNINAGTSGWLVDDLQIGN